MDKTVVCFINHVPIQTSKSTTFSSFNKSNCTPTSQLNIPQLFRRIISNVGRKQNRASKPKSKIQPKVTTSEEWRELIYEFEERANRGRDKPKPQNYTAPLLNPAQFEYLSTVETAAMIALTVALWFFGRILRMDVFLLLSYPLPMMYVAARWGLSYADRGVVVILLMLSFLLGPFSSFVYFCNTGILTIAYTRCLWYRAPWQVTLLVGGFAKALGLYIQIRWVSLVLQYNSWKLIGEQVLDLVTGSVAMLNKLPFFNIVVNLQVSQIQTTILIVLILHSIYHVFFTQVLSDLIIYKAAETEKVERLPKTTPLVKFLLKRTRELDRR